MSADDSAQKSASTEPINSQKSTYPTPATLREEQASLAVGESHSSGESGPSTEDGHVDQEAKEVESRDIMDAGEVAKAEIEVLGEGAEPSSESFAESGDSSEIPEAGEGVLAWSPEEDHEHKRVKVSSYVPFIYLLKFHLGVKFYIFHCQVYEL